MNPSHSNRSFTSVLGAWTSLGVLKWLGLIPLFALNLSAAEIPLLNGSFESPAVAFVSTEIDSWQKSSKPAWYEEGDGFLWSQLTGLFKNTSSGSFDHIDNCDGNQAMWLFAVPEVGLTQELTPEKPAEEQLSDQSIRGLYATGHRYVLTAGVMGMGGGMSNGVTLELGLFYRTETGSRGLVASTTITNSPAIFSNRTHLVSFEVRTPVVKPEDAWANRPIGISLMSTVGFELQGGYWDLDNLRLMEITPPRLTVLGLSGDTFVFNLESEPDQRFEILTSSVASRPLPEWQRLTTVTNETGVFEIKTTTSDAAARYYIARELLRLP